MFICIHVYTYIYVYIYIYIYIYILVGPGGPLSDLEDLFSGGPPGSSRVESSLV